MKRPCLTCGELTERSRCPVHERQQQRRYDAHRGSTTQRGYGTEHQRAREQLAATLPRPCGYCGVTIHPGERWDAAHVVDGHPEYGLMVAHPVCNQRARGAGVVRKLGKVAS